VRPHRGSSHHGDAGPAGQHAGSRRRLVRVPASSANLGPGFDAFAAALALHLELEVEETGSFAVETDLAVARDRRNLVVRGFARLASPDRFTFRVASRIPLSGGLGSSAAAYVAGLLAADHLFELDADVLALATELEGHPDNVAAALHGGVVVVADGAVARLEAPAGLEAVLVVPHQPVRTKAARAAMPREVPLADAVFNTAHGALLAAGLARGDLELVARGLADRLHQPRREHLYPRSMALLRRAPELGALGATISGAGPTVLVWCAFDTTAAVATALRREAEGWAEVLRAPFEGQGGDVRAL
jgi:homoserine kinase